MSSRGFLVVFCETMLPHVARCGKIFVHHPQKDFCNKVGQLRKSAPVADGEEVAGALPSRKIRPTPTLATEAFGNISREPFYLSFFGIE